MKKIIAVSALLILAAACSAPPTNRSVAVPANKPTETKPALPIVSLAEMEAREKASWEAIQKKDYDAFANLLANEYLEVESGGLFDKAGIIANVKDTVVSEVNFSDWKLLPVDKDAVVLLYRLVIKWTYKGQAIPPGPYRVSSAWVNRDGKWLAIYYQQTEVKAAPAAPPSASQAAKAAASPAGTLAEAGSDPIANEKSVWAAFKSKNYDAFAVRLAPEFVEVEADGIYDKAGSVKGVSMFDAAKTEQSEWKAVNFDADAALVTYLVKYANGPAERHSTIWFNRGGKWLALFHHGTQQQATVSNK